ncbi:MAG: hypothetical protein AMS20_12305 [Gemmatimonas sp. SG8_28]|nr:MAG: hypothetical protein AMS20_12305 [Gemmatimonas sp. SG8_28]
MLLVRSFLVGLFATAALAGQLAAQTTGTIRGRVVAAGTREPLAEVRVNVADRAARTDADGQFVVSNVPAGTYTVQARMLGYSPAEATATVAAGQTATVELVLTPQAVSLSAIVVTGYGEQQAGNITGAVQEVSVGEFNPGVIVSPAQLISGKVAGVQVVDNNEPGGGLSLRIRGPTSVNASSEPLYVIDGQPIGTGAGGGINAGRDALNFLNPNDIQSMTVLKDASAAAIYGANAANGVVLIQTKRGQGAPHLRYTGTVSASQVTRIPDLLNATQFEAAVAEYAPTRVDSLLGQSTDWYGEIDRTAIGQDHNVALSGSGEHNDYRVSVGYLNQQGIILASNTERLSLGVAFDQRLFDDNLSLNVNLKNARSSDEFTPSDVLGNAAAMAPTQPVLDPTSPTGYWDWHTTNASPSNPVASIDLASNSGVTYRSLGSVQARYILPFFPDLKANVNLAYDAGKADRQIFNPNNLAAQIRQGHGQLNQSSGTDLNTVLETYLNYASMFDFMPGEIDLTGGYSYTNQHSDWLYYNASGLSSNLLGDNGIVPADNVSNSEYITDYRLISFFGRLNYNIEDRYLLSASVRRDGSSRFGAGNQWGTFPSVSGAWRISQESFLRNWSTLSDLKIRASWAKTGNQAFGDYLQYSTYTYSDPLTQYQFGDQFVSTIRPSAVDPNIHWEETDAYNIGLDYGFSNQRFSGSFEWYVKKTKDLIFFVPVAAGTNLSNYVTTNVGNMENRGFEFSLSAELLQGGASSLNWTADFNFSYNTNELTSINPSQSVSKILVGGISGGVGNLVQVLQPGVPVNSFFVYEQEYDDTGKPIEGSYVDLNDDGVINDSDRRPFNSPAPKWILAHTSYVNWGKFDLGFTLRAYLDNYVYNNVASALGAYQNLTGSAMPANLHASVLETDFVVPQYYSDYYVEDASFLRMDNITIGYTFLYRNQPWRVFATVQNAFTLTGYSGVDPTAGINGIDNNIYPRSRLFSGGVNVRF